jgi:hypothetical protein
MGGACSTHSEKHIHDFSKKEFNIGLDTDFDFF